MIPFNNLGHCFSGLGEPIVWLDSSDSDSYTLTGYSSPELVTNGDFSDGLNDWQNLANTVNIVNGWALLNGGSPSDNCLLGQSILTNGVTYNVAFEVQNLTNYNNNCAFININGTQIKSIDSNGVYNFTFTHSVNDNRFFFRAWNGGSFEVTNVSIKEVLPDTQEVTSIDNKGTLGGQFELFGNVKFANNGFESWGGDDYITTDLAEPFLPNNSFTMATCFDFQNIVQNNNRGWWGSIYGNIFNRVANFRLDSDMYNQSVSSSNFNINATAYNLGVQTLISSYDLDTNTLMLINFDGTNDTFTSITYNNVTNSFVWLLRSGSSLNTSSAQNNPLHEFRLYNKSFTLTEMQDLQIELNNKYI